MRPISFRPLVAVATTALAATLPACETVTGDSIAHFEVQCPFGTASATFFRTPFQGSIGTLPPGYVLCDQFLRDGYAVCVHCLPHDPVAPRYASINCTAPFRALPPGWEPESTPRTSGTTPGTTEGTRHQEWVASEGDHGDDGSVPTCLHVTADDTTVHMEPPETRGGVGAASATVTFTAPAAMALPPTGPFGVSVTVDDGARAPGAAIPAGATISVHGPATPVTGWLVAAGLRELLVPTALGPARVTVDPEFPIAATSIAGAVSDVRWIDPAMLTSGHGQ